MGFNNEISDKLLGRNNGRLRDILNEVKKFNKNVEYCCTDLTRYEEIKKAVDECIDSFGTIDILINNAGISQFDLIANLKISDWNDVINTNLNGYFYTTRLILPIMIKNKSGHIINIGSTMSKVTYPSFSAYNASKFGARAFTDVLSKEVVNKNIKVTFVGPGAIDTPIHAVIKGGMSEKERKEKFLKPSDVAEIILFIITRPDNLVIDEIYIYDLKSPYKVPLEE